MTYDTTESIGTSPDLLTRDLSHDLRTPLAVIRMQAQLMIRLTRRGAYGDASGRDRLVSGLQRIDDAVTKLNDVLDRVAGDRPGRDLPLAREIH
jgi:signal transduction histidine kinase